MKSAQLANGEPLGVPRRYTPTESNKDEKPNPEQARVRVMVDIAQAMYNNVGANGVILRATELYAE